MAIDRKNVDFLSINTLPEFSNWPYLEGGSSVLVDTATLPSMSSVGYDLDAEFNEALQSAEYRKFTLTMDKKPDLLSNYTDTQQIIIQLHFLYAANTNSQVLESDIEIIMNEDDIIENTDETFTLSRVINTNSRALQACNITITNAGTSQVVIRDARLQRSADINTQEFQRLLSQSQSEMTPRAFKVYVPTDPDILEGLGVITAAGVEYKYKPVVVNNQVVEIQTNFSEAMEVVYVPQAIDLTTTDAELGGET